MTNQLATFAFAPGLSLRIVMRGGDPWFVAKDVCEALLMNTVNGTQQWTKYLDKDETAHVKHGESPGLPNRGITVVSEPGLYSLILKSRKPEARAFKKWVTSVVLPAIRKDGAYVAPAVAVLAEEGASATCDNYSLRLGAHRA